MSTSKKFSAGAKKPGSKVTPNKKDIEDAAASVEKAIEMLEVEEMEVKNETADEKQNSEAQEPHEADVQDQPSSESGESVAQDQNETEVSLPEAERSQISDVGSVFSKSAVEEKSGSSKKSVIIIIICLCIIFTILGFFGGYLYAKNGNPLGGNTAASPTPTPTIELTSTPEAVDLSEYSIEILNGSGLSGVAGSEQEALEADGFSVENTGNAQNQNFTETVIAVKSNVSEEFIEKLRSSLSERYVVASGTEELDSDNDYDVVITIGSETIVDE